MTTKKFSMNEAQKAKLPAHRDKWIRIALSTDRIDRERATEAMRGLYRAADLPPPAREVFCDSPMTAGIVGPVAATVYAFRDAGENEATIMASAMAVVSRIEYPGGLETLLAATGGVPSKAAPNSDMVQDMLSATHSWYSAYNGGNQYASWVSFLSFFREHCPEMALPEWDKFIHYERAAEFGGPRFMYQQFWIMCERPEILKIDDQNRPHCSDGPSHRWRDGRTLHYWHGTLVPKALIESPETFVTPEWLAQETNSEVVRAAAERLGWAEFLRRADTRVVDSWTDPQTGLEYELLDWGQRPGDDAPRFLKMVSPVVKDGTQPQYVEPVHPALKTAQAARRWQFPKDLSSFAVRHGDVVVDAGDQPFEWPEPEWCNKNPSLVFDKEA